MGSILEKFGIKNKSELQEWRRKEAAKHNDILRAFSIETERQKEEMAKHKANFLTFSMEADRQVIVASSESTEIGHNGKG